MSAPLNHPPSDAYLLARVGKDEYVQGAINAYGWTTQSWLASPFSAKDAARLMTALAERDIAVQAVPVDGMWWA